MGEVTGIEWCHHTFNPWVGCTKVSPACDNCYAEGWAKRTGQANLWAGERRLTSTDYWKQPLKWNRIAAKAGVRRRVFCASLADVFDNQAEEAWREWLWGLIQQTQALDWLLLTKRPQNIRKMLPANWGPRGWSNVWLGTTAEDAFHYRQRYGHLQRVPAQLHFISYEPALGDLGSVALDGYTPDWIICGGESGGPKSRPMDLEWARNVRDQCAERHIPFFMKQVRNKGEIPPDLQLREFPQ